MTSMLDFVGDCIEDQPLPQSVEMELAKSIINMLVTKGYFLNLERDIRYNYPHLLQGLIGQKLERAWERKA